MTLSYIFTIEITLKANRHISNKKDIILFICKVYTGTHTKTKTKKKNSNQTNIIHISSSQFSSIQMAWLFCYICWNVCCLQNPFWSSFPLLHKSVSNGTKMLLSIRKTELNSCYTWYISLVCKWCRSYILLLSCSMPIHVHVCALCVCVCGTIIRT